MKNFIQKLKNKKQDISPEEFHKIKINFEIQKKEITENIKNINENSHEKTNLQNKLSILEKNFDSIRISLWGDIPKYGTFSHVKNENKK